jgi:HK97 family phage prohead protease
MNQQPEPRRIPGEEIKAFSRPAEYKADFPQRLITAYWSIFNNVDEVDDLVIPVAFNKTIADRFPGDLIKSFFDHEVPIGMPRALEADSKGLLAVTKVLDGAEFDKYLQMVIERLSAHASFAYDIKKRDFIPGQGDKPIRVLQEVKLYEGGPVIFPANEQAVVLGAKSAKELKELIYGARAHVGPVLAKDGLLNDKELATMAEEMPILTAAKHLQKHLQSLESRMLAAERALSHKALSEGQPESSAQADAATTPTLEPPPTTGEGVTDPEADAYLSTVAAEFASLRAHVAVASMRAAAH